MEDKLDSENRPPKQSSMEEKGRILVKVILPKAPAPEEVAEIDPAAAENAHYCKECGKGFSSGKALGGHMSSAHVQANKEHHYSKKLKSSIKNHHLKDSGATAEHICTLCGKDFRSPKSLFGHMRCHPERVWRGMEPPAAAEQIGPPSEDSSERGFANDDQIYATAPAVAELDFSLNWAMRAKRGGRGMAVRPPQEAAAIDSPRPPPPPPLDVPSEENEILVAQQLMKLFKDVPMEKAEEKEDNKYLSLPELENTDRDCGSKKRKRDYSRPENEWPYESIKNLKIRDCKSVPKLKICERGDYSDGAHCRRKIGKDCDNGKGNENVDCEGQLKGKSQGNHGTKSLPASSDSSSNSSKIAFPYGIESNTAANYLINQKQEANSHARAQKTQVVVTGDENTASPSQTIAGEGKTGTASSGGSPTKKYYCEICDKSYPTHQAFGGHKSSHNKVKITIVNSCDMTNGNAKISNPRKKGNLGSGKSCSPDDQNKSHACKKCGKGFASARALGGHKKSHANDDAEAEVKVVLDIDLNKEPDEEDGIDGEHGKDADKDDSSSSSDNEDHN